MIRAVREMAGKTQLELAKAVGAARANCLSGRGVGCVVRSHENDLRRRMDHLLSTLRRSIEALGGKFEVIARIGDKTVRPRGA